MSGKDKLKDMLDAIVNKNNDSAKVTFHSYLQDKFKSVLNPTIEQPSVEIQVKDGE